MVKKIFRCAIYTRKSTEEGLEQDFNSLDAQREACEAYIKSQQHEGWILIEKQYNDGGYSGGNLQRPALQDLFNDIKNNKIDIIVVYKVDRLTRSLLDFAKIVELFDTHNSSFVSVTQNFNTTTSMGRLTLNILLSFAQFEREVTGERIRDKIAASKKKGMWMGGRVPIGYKRVDKKLIIHEENAKIVQLIFDKYLSLKSVPKLKEYLQEHNIKTQTNLNFAKGQLYHILQNQIYIGKIAHKNNIYNGEHKAIITSELFSAVQKLLEHNKINIDREYSSSNSLLAGKLFDDNNNRMTPSHSKTRKKKYRYYISQAISKLEQNKAGSVSKLPAKEIEDYVCNAIIQYFQDIKTIQKLISELNISKQNKIIEILKTIDFKRTDYIKLIIDKVIISKDWIEIYLSEKNIKKALYNLIDNVENINALNTNNNLILLKNEIKFSTGTSKGCNKLIIGNQKNVSINECLVKAIIKSYYWNNLLLNGTVKNTKEIQNLESMKDNSYIKQILNLRFLSPKIITDILNGTQPKDLTVSKLFTIKTLIWSEQEKLIY